MTDENDVDGGAEPIDYGNMPRPETLKSLNDDEWNATPPQVRKAFVEQAERSKTNHGEQIQRLTGEMNAMREMLASRNGSEQPAAQKQKAAGIAGMELSELEAYEDQAQGILDLARSEPDNAAAQREAAKLTPQVMRELRKEIARKAVGVSKDDIEALRAELRSKDEASRLTGALTSKITSEFGAASILPGNALRMNAEKAYTELQQSIKDGMTPETALQYAAYKIAASNGNGRDGRSNGVEANGNRRLAGTAQDTAGILRGLKTGAAALRARGDEMGAIQLEVEADVFSGLPENLFGNNGR